MSNKIKRILLKISGEALLGNQQFGVDPKVLIYLAKEIRTITEKGIELGIVIGGGNIFRGEGLAQSGIDRVTGDQMGMLATIINALAIQDALEREGQVARVMSALKVNEVCEDYIRRRAIRHLEKNRVVIIAAGTGNPFFTTDTAGCLRAIETQSDLMLKATRVDGVYDSDPEINSNAVFYPELSFDDAISQNLKVMDATALTLARDHKLPIKVFNVNTKDALKDIICGEKIGTLIS